ncbi:MAG: hypothetical protein WC906_01305 [Parcubacteria group bacterium]|jgi:cbb3-type cytochrome oxidase subunit 3
MKYSWLNRKVIAGGIILILVLSYLIGKFNWEPFLIKFLNSNFFIALITLSAGYVAYYIYKEQKKEYKADAAMLIVQEIRFAEGQIKKARERDHVYPLSIRNLPTNSWHKNIHLFINDLAETELDTISKFYSSAEYLDIVIQKISDKKNDQVLAKPISKGEERSSQIIQQQEEIQIEMKFVSEIILRKVSSEFEFIYNTPAVDKLRAIAEGKL